MAANPPPGGRGGRGLALLQQLRRPGAPAAPEAASPAPEMLNVATPEATPVHATPGIPDAPTAPVGRGRGAQVLFAKVKSSSVGDAASPPTTIPSAAALPHAGKHAGEPQMSPVPGATTPVAGPIGRGAGRGAASGLMLLKQRQVDPGTPSSTTQVILTDTGTSTPSATPAETPPSTTVASVVSTPSTKASSTMGSGSVPTTKVTSATSGSGTGASGSGQSTTTSGAISGADTLSSSIAKMHLKKPRGSPIVKKGDNGKACPMQTNYIHIRTDVEQIFQYHVSFDPPVDARNVRFSLVKQQKEGILGKVMAFDGLILYLPHKLPEPITILQAVRRTDNQTITLKIQLTNILPWDECPKVFNIIFGRVMNALKLVEVGRNKYDDKASVRVPQHKLEVWPGYITHITEQEGGLLLMADVSHRVLRIETCFDVMSTEHNRTKGGPTFHSECVKQIVGQIVLTRYNNNTYRVDDIDWNQSPKSTFPLRSGGEMSYVEYYKNHYGIEIKDHDQPLLLHCPRLPKRAPNEPQPTQVFLGAK
jgi:hypothetical protein